MTENEAIKHLQSYAEVVDNMIKYCKDFEPKADITGYLEKKTVFAMAISAIKEVQQYREIGTVEEFRKTADRNNQKQPVWKNGRSTIFKDYVDGHGEAEENKWADWVCPECGWFVGEQYLPRQHNQSKCNFCPKCGQAIRWEN